ncbi:MAG TPA: PaaI family thioesterase [Pseudolabrys sp.]|nr:PaaI family thioesterase [Pseudolabrys sp.]
MDQKNYGVAAADVRSALDGLTFLKAVVAGTQPQAPICELLGFRLTAVDTGRAVFEGIPRFQHYNPFGTVHGGFAATMLDSALGCAVASTLAKGEAFTTLEFKINLVRALTDRTGPVRAEARILHRGRTVATSEADLKDESGKLYAHATTTCMIFAAKA